MVIGTIGGMASRNSMPPHGPDASGRWHGDTNDELPPIGNSVWRRRL